MRKVPFRVFEAGAGEIPYGLIGQALKARKRGLNREFTAADVALLAEQALRQRNLTNAPSNLKLVRNCAMDELKKLPTESHDIVFGSYFLNNYAGIHGERYHASRAMEYFAEARRVLKPNGRIIIIQDNMFAGNYVEFARKMGFSGVTRVKLPLRFLEGSTAFYIEQRATREGRLRLINHDIERYPALLNQARGFADENNLKDISEAYWPTAVVIKK